MVYELMQNATNKEHQYNPPAHMISGATAGALAAAITTPLDVCKTLLNTQQVGGVTSMMQAVRTVYLLGGVRGFFRGMAPRVMYQMPSTAICWSTYEFFKYILGHTRLVDEVRLVSNAVFAEDSIAVIEDEIIEDVSSAMLSPSSAPVATPTNVSKILEIPSMSGAGLYGAVSFNTMHGASTGERAGFRRQDLTST